MSNHNTDHAKGLLLTGIGGLVLSVDIPLIRLAQGDAWSILAVRTGTTFVAALLIWSIWRLMTPSAPKLIPGRTGFIVAALYGVGSIFFITSVFNTTTANVVFILAFNTMFAALLSWIFLGERPRRVTLVAMAIMLFGVLIIVWDSIGTGNLFGDLMAAGSALSVAAAITISRASEEDMGFTSLIGVIIPFVIAGIMIGKSSAGLQIEVPLWIILNGTVVMPFAFYCLAAGPRYLTGPEVAMFYLLETVLAPIWVWLIFYETPTRNSLIGGGILIAALVAHSLWQLAEGRKRRAATAVKYPA